MDNLDQQIEEAAGNLLQYLIPDINKATLHQHKNAAAAITLTIKSQAVKAYHTQGMYSEEEVLHMFEKYQRFRMEEELQRLSGEIGELDCTTIYDWFEQNKKK